MEGNKCFFKRNTCVHIAKTNTKRNDKPLKMVKAEGLQPKGSYF
jgi:hypothetical protein